MTILRDKMIKAAQTVIRCQEGLPATVEDWKLIGARGHEVIASVSLIVERLVGDAGDRTFDVWVVIDLDTEEVYCL